MIDELQNAFDVCSIFYVSLMFAVVESKRKNLKIWGRIVKVWRRLKVFKICKICGRQPLKYVNGYGLPQSIFNTCLKSACASEKILS